MSDAAERAHSPRPPFAFLFHYYGGWYGPKEWEDIWEIDQYFAESAVDAIGLPLEHDVRYISTDSFRIFPTGTTTYSDERSLAWVTLGFMDDLDDHIEILEGIFPRFGKPPLDLERGTFKFIGTDFRRRPPGYS